MRRVVRQIEPGAERVARAGDGHHPDVVILGRLVHGADHAPGQGLAEGVLLLRPVQRDGADMAAVADLQNFAHGQSLSAPSPLWRRLVEWRWRGVSPPQTAVTPPSTARVWPVMCLPASDANSSAAP